MNNKNLEVIPTSCDFPYIEQTIDSVTEYQMYSELKDDIDTAVDRVQDIADSIDVDIKDLNDRINTNKSNIETNANSIEANSLVINNVTDKINKNTEDIAENNNLIRQTEEQIRKNTENIAYVKRVSDQNLADIKKINPKLDSISSDINTLKPQVERNSKNIDNIIITIPEIQSNTASINKLKTDVKNNTDEINANKEAISKVNTDILANKDSINKLETTVTMLDKDIDTNTVNINLNKQAITNNSTNIDEANKQIINNSLSIDNINDEVNLLTEEVSDVKQDIGLIKVDQTLQNKAIQKNVDDIHENKNDIADLRRDLQGVLFKNTEKGNPIVLTDSGEASLVDYKVEGETTQITTEGYNSFNYKAPTSGANNATIEILENGFKINKLTPSASDYIGFAFNFEKAGDYFFKMDFAPKSNDVRVIIFDEHENYEGAFYRDGTFRKFSVEESKKGIHYIYFYPNRKEEQNSTMFTNIQISTKDVPYEPYSNGVASPSPEFSQPIENARIESITNHGTNLAQSYFIDSIKNQFAGKIYAKFNIKPNTTYIIKFNSKENYKIYENEKIFTTSVTYVTKSYNKIKLKTLPNILQNQYDEEKGWRLFKNSIDETIDLSVTNFMIYEGEEEIPYEPYKGDTYTFSKPIDLASNQDIRDSIEKNKETGNWEKVKRIFQYEMTGEEDLKDYGTNAGLAGQDSDFRASGWKPPKEIKINEDTSQSQYIMSNYYKSVKEVDTYLKKEGISVIPTTKMPVFYNKKVKSSAELRQLLKDLKAQGKPMIIQYAVTSKEYERIPLPEEDSAMLDKIQTFYPNTTLITQSGQEIVYLADGKLYVDRRIKELTQKVVEEVTRTNNAIVAMGGETNV